MASSHSRVSKVYVEAAHHAGNTVVRLVESC